MRYTKVQFAATCLIACFAAVPAAQAQWAVIDAPAIVQLIQEVQTMAQQLQIGITWGGDWSTFKDGPHYELRS